jgi:hypothetical protein
MSSSGNLTNLGFSAETNVLYTSAVKYNTSKATNLEINLPLHALNNDGTAKIKFFGGGLIETLLDIRFSSGTDLNDVLLHTRRYVIGLNSSNDFEIFDLVDNDWRMRIDTTTGATTFNPPLAGITASTIATTNSSTNSDFYLPFVSNYTTNASQSVFTNGFLFYNPSTGNLVSTIMTPATLSFDGVFSGFRKWEITGSSNISMVAYNNNPIPALNGCAFTISDTGLVSILGSTSGPTTGLRLYDRTTNTNYWDTFSTAGTTLTNQYNGTTKKTLTNGGFMTLSGSNTGLRLSDRTDNTNYWDTYADVNTLYIARNTAVNSFFDSAGLTIRSPSAGSGGILALQDRTTNNNIWKTFSLAGTLTNNYNDVTKMSLTENGFMTLSGSNTGLRLSDRTDNTNYWDTFSTGGTLTSQYNGTTKSALTTTGDLKTSGAFNGFTVSDRTTAANTWTMYADGGASTSFRIFSSIGAANRLTLTSAGGLTTTGFITNGSLALSGLYILGAGATTVTAGNWGFYTGGTTLTMINTGTGGTILFRIEDFSYYFMNASAFSPQTDNTVALGESTGKRWTVVYAVNGTIQTSDAREKTEITPSALGLDFINKLKPVSYRWKVGQNNIENE